MQLNEIHNNHEHASVSLKVILLVFAVILVGVLGYLVWDYQKGQDPTNEESTGTIITTNKTYTEANNLFSFKYDKNLTVASASEDKSDTSDKITVKVYDLTTMEDEPFGYDKKSLTSLRDDLLSGDVKTAKTGLYAKDTIILAALEVCDVQFTRTLDIFKGNTLVSIRLSLGATSKAKIIAEDSSYFVIDEENCSGEKRWEDSKQYQEDLLADKTGTTSKKWLKNFNAILNSFAFSS
jgi:hypothetical protein